MKKKKLTLDDLKVESFTTSLDSAESKKIFGGDIQTNGAEFSNSCDTVLGCAPGGPPQPPADTAPPPTQTTVQCNTTSDCPLPTDPGAPPTGSTPPTGAPPTGGAPPVGGGSGGPQDTYPVNNQCTYN